VEIVERVINLEARANEGEGEMLHLKQEMWSMMSELMALKESYGQGLGGARIPVATIRTAHAVGTVVNNNTTRPPSERGELDKTLPQRVGVGQNVHASSSWSTIVVPERRYTFVVCVRILVREVLKRSLKLCRVLGHAGEGGKRRLRCNGNDGNGTRPHVKRGIGAPFTFQRLRADCRVRRSVDGDTGNPTQVVEENI
jgi:hypothetical protein